MTLPRTISSKWGTLLNKGIMPAMQVVMTIVMLKMFLRSMTSPEDVRALMTIIVIMCGAGLIGYLFVSRKLMNIELDHGGMNVSGYLTSDYVPYSCIKDVKQTFWSNNKSIKIKLREGTSFGKSISFIPQGRAPFLQSHPIIAELRQLAGLVKSVKTDTPPPLPAPNGSLQRIKEE